MPVDVSPEWVAAAGAAATAAVGFWKWADSKIDALRVERLGAEEKMCKCIEVLQSDARIQERRFEDRIGTLATKDDLHRLSEQSRTDINSAFHRVQAFFAAARVAGVGE
jgi:hypothetical protein